MDKRYEFAQRLAREAGEVMLAHFARAATEYELKGDNTPVSAADIAINRHVIRELAAAYPEDAVLGEEESAAIDRGDRRGVWVCDPIDGTFPFTHGIPTSTFNLAYVVGGIVQLGVTFDPYLGRMYKAILGGGAYLNDLLLDVTQTQEPARGAMAIELRCGKGSILPEIDKEVALYRQLLEWQQVPVHQSSIAYEAMLVASGEMNGVVFGGCNPWDGAAISLIVREAGGIVTDLKGQDQRYDAPIYGYIAARPSWHARMVEAVSCLLE